jgi:hypothetical protein
MSEPSDDIPSPTALARCLVAEGRGAEAEGVVSKLIAENFDFSVRSCAINADWSSLNSLNGTVEAEDGRRFFFKFHQEEGEEATVQEYYRAELLQRAGLPVDVPAMVCRKPGHQILLYAFRRDRTLADFCLQMERTGDLRELEAVVQLQAELDRVTGESYVASLKPSRPELSAAEPVHQLFYNRLVTPPDIEKLGGRIARFYEEQLVELPTGNLSWEHFKALHWRINGIDYSRTIDELFNDSLARLSPPTIAKCGGVIAHGDAHNANVWVERREERSRLVLFDPAFAGEHVPSLLADVKATFHNIFAHPFWLYHPAEADERLHVDVSLAGDCLVVEHDWKLASPRREFLVMKIELIWRPLLAALRDRGLLTTDWRRVVRLALFCCPTLVMSLRAGASHGATVGRSPKISALSFAIAVMAGCEPQRGADPFSTFLDEIAPLS